MEDKGFFGRALEVLKQRPSMVFLFIGANLIASIVFLLLVALFVKDTGQQLPLTGKIFFIAYVVGASLQSLAFGAATLMGWRVLAGQKTTLGSAIVDTLKRWFHILTAGLLLSTAMAIGIAFFILPGLVVAFAFMFTFAFLMVEQTTALDAMKQSLMLVKAEFKSALRVFATLMGLSFLVLVMGRLFLASPFMGQLIITLMLSVLFTYTAVVLVVFYKDKTQTKVTPTGGPNGI